MKKTLAVVLLLVALPAFAHPGHDSSPLRDGLLHPLTGLDHLLMLLGTGVLAALTRRSLGLPLATLAAMVGGAVCGHLVGDVLGMEAMIAVSVWVIAGALLLPSRQRLLAVIMPMFALFHGWAHGVEATPSAFWLFGSGFVLVSTLLLAVGFAVGCLLRRHTGLQKAVGGDAGGGGLGAGRLMDVDLALLRLLQLASPGLPVGGFTYSQGLEWAVEAGWVRDTATFAAWQREQLNDTLGYLDWPVLARLYHACQAMMPAPSRIGAASCWPTVRLPSCGWKNSSVAVRWRGCSMAGSWAGPGLAGQSRPEPTERHGLAWRALVHPVASVGLGPRLCLARKRGDGRGQAGAVRPAGGPDATARPGAGAACRARSRPGAGR